MILNVGMLNPLINFGTSRKLALFYTLIITNICNFLMGQSLIVLDSFVYCNKEKTFE